MVNPNIGLGAKGAVRRGAKMVMQKNLLGL